MIVVVLPNFTEHEGHEKLAPMAAPNPPVGFVRGFVERQTARLGRDRSAVRVLDVGCGRGDTVAWLCDNGWDAYGIDVDERYLEQGRVYLTGDRLLRLDGAYPFPGGHFDIVLSDQVLEHVANVDRFAAEVSRVTAPGGSGLHIFPARWRPVEVHLHAPLVHWLPKGNPRRTALRLLLSAGLAAPYFQGYGLDDRVEIFGAFSDDETFYRPLRVLDTVFGRHGLRCDWKTPSQDKLRHHLPAFPGALLPAAGLLYRHVFSVCMVTTKR